MANHPTRTVLARLGTLVMLVGSVLAAPAARAEITPDAQRVVDRYIEASGGRAAFDSVRTTRLEARITAMGFQGTTTTYAERPNRRASRTQLGPFHIPEGFDGTAGWRTDPSGKVNVLDAKELEDARSSAYFENVMWIAPDQGGGRIAVAATERDSAGRYTVLEITPPGGRPRRFWFNDVTGLIDRESMKRDQQTIVGTLSDYRRVGGRLVPHKSYIRIVDLPANDLSIEVDRIVVNEPIDPAVFRPPAAETTRVTWLETPGKAVIPFRYEARHVWVRASVDGAEPADFLFDTGASLTILDSTYAARLGLTLAGEMQSMGAGSTGSARFSQIRTLRVLGDGKDGVEIRDQQVGVLSVNPFLQPFFWRPCAGVIGADLISRVVTQIDYDRSIMTMQDAKAFRYTGKGTAVPITLAGNIPIVRMTLDGSITGDFRLDVGSSSSVDFHGPFVRKHALATKPGKKLLVVSGGFGGTFTSTLTRLRSLQIGPYAWKDPLVSFSGASSGALASEDYAGNIGNQILERFVCTFDYDRRTLYLEPGKRYGRRDRFSRAGVQLALIDSTVRAMQVLAGSPAFKAGLRESDEVAAIDGRPAVSYSPEQLRVLFDEGAPGRVVKLDVVQADRRRRLEMRLGEIL